MFWQNFSGAEAFSFQTANELQLPYSFVRGTGAHLMRHGGMESR